MQTLEQIREKIKANFPKEAPSETLQWNRETLTTLVSSCNRFRVSKVIENGTACYFAWMVGTPTSAPRAIGGRFMKVDEAKEALQFLVGSPGSVRQPAGAP